MAKPKQLSILPKTKKPRREHGGSLTHGKRRAYRPMNPRLSLHVTLKSHKAIGKWSLFNHRKLIESVLRKSQRLFHVKVYNYAIHGNHIHISIKGYSRESIQNFFRVFAGHSAQQILELCPLPEIKGGAPQKGCKKNQRKFWSYLLYSRVVSWGRDFRNVQAYIGKNARQVAEIIDYWESLTKPQTFKSSLRLVNSS